MKLPKNLALYGAGALGLLLLLKRAGGTPNPNPNPDPDAITFPPLLTGYAITNRGLNITDRDRNSMNGIVTLTTLKTVGTAMQGQMVNVHVSLVDPLNNVLPFQRAITPDVDSNEIRDVNISLSGLQPCTIYKVYTYVTTIDNAFLIPTTNIGRTIQISTEATNCP